MVGLGSAGETAFIFRRILLTAGHENWIEQRSKQDSNNYLIAQFCLQLLRYNYPANGKEREKTFVFYSPETVMRDTSNAGMQSCTKSCYSIEYSILVHCPKAGVLLNRVTQKRVTE